MATYTLGDIAIESSIPIPELVRAECREPEFAFSLRSAPSPPLCHCSWFHEWCLPDGGTWLRLGRDDQGYRLRFPGLADFILSADAKEIRCYPHPDVPLYTLKHLFLDQVIPLALSSRGRLVLHASSVATPDGAIAFVGPTGSGKSTLASSFCEKGFAHVTDDCLLINEEDGRVMVTPSYPGLRLWPHAVDALSLDSTPASAVAHYSDKKRLRGSDAMPFCSDPAPLRRLFFLSTPEDHDSGISIDRMSPRDAFIELVKFTYVLDITDRVMLKRLFERLSRLSLMPLSHRLSFPRDFSLLPRVHESILKNLKIGA